MKNQDFKKEITQQIIKLMQDNGSSWIKSWAGDTNINLQMPINTTTGNYYQGINVLKLWFAEKSTNEWATYKQWQDKDKQVKKGEKGTSILRFIQIIKDGENAENGVIPIMKSFTVFNADQLEGHQPNKNTGKGEKFNHQAADHFIANTKAIIKHGGESAYYSTTGDYINIPEMQDFIDTGDATAEQSYYGVLLHEITHWTKHVKRLDRKKSNNKKDYAFEELVAELGSCFLAAHLGTEPTIKKDHAKYLNHWVEILKDDEKAILKAASLAGKAFDFLLNLQEQKNKNMAA